MSACRKYLYGALALFFVVSMFAGCDYSIRIISYEFGEFPRVVYIAGVDTELDFSKATLIVFVNRKVQQKSLKKYSTLPTPNCLSRAV